MSHEQVILSTEPVPNYRERDLSWKKYLEVLRQGIVLAPKDRSEKEQVDISYACTTIILENIYKFMPKPEDITVVNVEKGLDVYDWFYFYFAAKIPYKEMGILETFEEEFLSNPEEVLKDSEKQAFKAALLTYRLVRIKDEPAYPSGRTAFEDLPVIFREVKRLLDLNRKNSEEDFFSYLRSDVFLNFLVRLFAFDDFLLKILRLKGLKDGAILERDHVKEDSTSPFREYKEGVFVMNNGRFMFDPVFFEEAKKTWAEKQMIVTDPDSEYRNTNRGCPVSLSEQRKDMLLYIINSFIDIYKEYNKSSK